MVKHLLDEEDEEELALKEDTAATKDDTAQVSGQLFLIFFDKFFDNLKNLTTVHIHTYQFLLPMFKRFYMRNQLGKISHVYQFTWLAKIHFASLKHNTN